MNQIKQWRAAQKAVERAKAEAERAKPSKFTCGGGFEVEVGLRGDADITPKRDADYVTVAAGDVPRLAAYLLRVWGGEIPDAALNDHALRMKRFIQATRPIFLNLHKGFEEGTEPRAITERWLSDCAELVGPVPEPVVVETPPAEPVSIPSVTCDPGAAGDPVVSKVEEPAAV